MFITNVFSRKPRQSYVVEWCKELSCWGLFKGDSYTDKFGNKCYSLEDCVFLGKDFSFSSCGSVVVIDVPNPQTIKAVSDDVAINKFKCYVRNIYAYIKKFGCGL